jgi:hypothetical protein
VAPRAYWKGYLKLSLVSCPVALFPASSEREKISFNQISKKTGNRIRWSFVGQHSKGLPEFIQQDGRIDPCSCNALTSVAGGYQCRSLRIVHRQLLQLTLHCFVKPGCYQLAFNYWSTASEARRYGGDRVLTHFCYPRERQRKCPRCFTPT